MCLKKKAQYHLGNSFAFVYLHKSFSIDQANQYILLKPEIYATFDLLEISFQRNEMWDIVTSISVNLRVFITINTVTISMYSAFLNE